MRQFCEITVDELPKAPPAKNRGECYGNENEKILNHDVIARDQATRKTSDTRTPTKLM